MDNTELDRGYLEDQGGDATHDDSHRTGTATDSTSDGPTTAEMPPSDGDLEPLPSTAEEGMNTRKRSAGVAFDGDFYLSNIQGPNQQQWNAGSGEMVGQFVSNASPTVSAAANRHVQNPEAGDDQLRPWLLASDELRQAGLRIEDQIMQFQLRRQQLQRQIQAAGGAAQQSFAWEDRQSPSLISQARISAAGQIQAPFNEHAAQQRFVWEDRQSPSLIPQARNPAAGQIRAAFNEFALQQPFVREGRQLPSLIPPARNPVARRIRAPFNEYAKQQAFVWEGRRPRPPTSQARNPATGQIQAPFNEYGRQQIFVHDDRRLSNIPSDNESPVAATSQRPASISSNAITQSGSFADDGAALSTSSMTKTAGFPFRAEPRATVSSPETIRLLKALPSVDREGQHAAGADEVLNYSMEEFPYSGSPDYIGLSYVWGEENPASVIRVNGESVPIRHNLGQALSRIRTSDPYAYVWADALCINQQDDEEKSRLVQHMGGIFANAKLVYAWLGPIEKATEDSSTEDLLTHLSRLGSLFWENIGRKDIGKLNEGRLDLELVLAKNLDVLFGLFRRGEFPVEEYSSFSARPFWSRIWVLQEVYLAKNLHYLCGHCRLESRMLAGALILLETFQRHLIRSQGSLREQVETNATLAKFAFRLPSFPEIHRLVIYTSIYPSDVVSLRIAMTNFCVKELPSGSRATDPRDMIYGLLGFANDEEKAYIQADYSKSVQETYTITTRRMTQNGFTDILAWAQPEKKRIAHLPSWVPDFSSTIHESLCSQGQAKAWLPQFKACGETRYSDEGARLVSPLVLPVHGRRLGVILDVGRQAWFPRSHARAEYPPWSAGAGEALLTRSVPHERLLAFLMEIRDLGQRAETMLGLNGATRRGSPGKAPRETDVAWRVPCCDQAVIDSRLVRQDPATRSCYEETLSGLRACIEEPGRELPPQSRPYIEALLRWVNKRPFLTANGLVGLGPADGRPGDVVAVLEGFSACYVLRCHEGLEKNEFTLVGEAYVDGAMDGEMMSSSDSDCEWFYLL